MTGHRFVGSRGRSGDGWVDPEEIPSAFTATRDEFASRSFAPAAPEPEPDPLDVALDALAAEAPHRD